MKQVISDLLTNNYTIVCHERHFTNNAPHYYEVHDVYTDGKDNNFNTVIGAVEFQEGPIKTHGVNGVMNEDLLAMVISRLDHFQDSEYACYENEMAVLKLEEALMWLRKRTTGRENRGVEGTHKV